MSSPSNNVCCERVAHASDSPYTCRCARYALHLFWSPLETSSGAKAHLRVFLLLRSISFALSTLQLRSGYPPPASYRCAPRLSHTINAALCWTLHCYPASGQQSCQGTVLCCSEHTVIQKAHSLAYHRAGRVLM